MLRLLPVLILASCALELPPPEPAPEVGRWTADMDWQAAGDEAADVLSAYLTVDTVNPPGNETEGAEFLAGFLEAQGIEHEIVEMAPGRGSLIAWLRGSGKQKPLCLLSHIDVVPGDPALWPEGQGPLSGAVVDDTIWGRGALDMKGMGVLELMTMVWLRRLNVQLNRDVVLLAVADEEVANGGMKDLVNNYWGRIGCSHMINEGGIGIRDALFEDQTLFAISVGEKGVLWLRMTAHGKGGHGSTPRPDTAPARLVDAINKIRARDVDPVVHPSLEVLLARAGEHRGGMSGFVLQRPLLVDWFVAGDLMDNPGTRAALINTANVTGLDTGDHAPNVVPASASALVDCRVLPGVSAKEMIARLQEVVGPDITFEQLQFSPATVSPYEDPLYNALARNAVAGRDDAVAGPVLSVGFTDSMYARALGVRAYGLVPFEVTQEEAATMHGAHERVSVASVRRGLEVMLKTVIEVSVEPGAVPTDVN